MRVFLILLAVCACGFFAPLIWLHARADIRTVQTAEPVEAVLIFGALVRDGVISPLHKQRLDTGIALLNQGKVQRIVVSNSRRAAGFMRDYLIQQGVSADHIEFDGTATHTPLTCVAERDRDTQRSVAFVSQTFHLPRLAFQCRQLGLTGQLITATGPSEADLWTKIRVRSQRHTREAALLWGAMLGLYPTSDAG